MKFFGNIFAVCSILLLAVIGAFAQTDDQNVQAVIDVIEAVTAKIESSQVFIFQTNSKNIGIRGKRIVAELQGISDALNQYTDDINEYEPFAESGAEEISYYVIGFARVFELLLSTLVNKHALAAQYFLTESIAMKLRIMESEFDGFATTLVYLIPFRTDQVETQLNGLVAAFQDAKDNYSS